MSTTWTIVAITVFTLLGWTLGVISTLGLIIAGGAKLVSVKRDPGPYDWEAGLQKLFDDVHETGEK